MGPPAEQKKEASATLRKRATNAPVGFPFRSLPGHCFQHIRQFARCLLDAGWGTLPRLDRLREIKQGHEVNRSLLAMPST